MLDYVSAETRSLGRRISAKGGILVIGDKQSAYLIQIHESDRILRYHPINFEGLGDVQDTPKAVQDLAILYI